jgi:protein SCO1
MATAPELCRSASGSVPCGPMSRRPPRFRCPGARTSLGILAVLARAAIVASIGACTPIQGSASHADEPHVTRVSLFSHHWIWTDESGQTVRFARWRGQPLIVASFYASCRATCVRTIQQMRKMQSRPEARGAQFLLVTLDPAADTPEVLREYKKAQDLPTGWHLLTGSESQTREFADALDIHVMDMDVHRFHDGRIVWFDADGMPTRSFSGWGVDQEAPVAARRSISPLFAFSGDHTME